MQFLGRVVGTPMAIWPPESEARHSYVVHFVPAGGVLEFFLHINHSLNIGNEHIQEKANLEPSLVTRISRELLSIGPLMRRKQHRNWSRLWFSFWHQYIGIPKPELWYVSSFCLRKCHLDKAIYKPHLVSSCPLSAVLSQLTFSFTCYCFYFSHMAESSQLGTI